MRMNHIEMTNIIHSDTDEVRASDIDNKIFECAGFQSCLLCLSNVYIIHSVIQPNQPFHLCWVILSAVSFWHGFPLYKIHTNALNGVAISLQALIWHFDMSHKILLFICSHLRNHLCHLTQWSHSWRRFIRKLFITVIDMLITRIVLK